jgi:predicted phage terminase large subunit-like protein
MLSDRDWDALVKLSQSETLEVQLSTLEAAIEHCTTELEAVWVELARDNYHDFYEFCVRDEGFTMSPHQTLIGNLLMASEAKETMRFMLSMPPGHCKSTHSSHHFPAWYLGRNPKDRFLQAGHSQDFVANELGAKVKSIIDSDDYQLVFPEVKLRTDMRAKDYWGLTNMKGKYVAKGVGQGISGFRGNYGGVDDPYKSRADAESPTIREKAFKWYSDDLSTRLLPGSPLGIIMTRWHSDDLCGRITDREEKEKREEAEKLREKQEAQLVENLEEKEGNRKRYRFEIINLPAIAEDADDPLGRAVGEALWPELFDLDALENLKADMTASSWNSLYQGTPMDVEGGAISAKWFQRYTEPPARANAETNTPNQIRRTVVSVDAANTAKERSDFTVITVWIEDFNRNHYLIDVIRKQMEFTGLCSEIDRVCKRYNADALLVEAKGNGLSYCQLKANGGAPCPLIPIEVGTSTKEFRFDEVSPMFEAGQIYLPERAVWLADYEKELVAFPNGKNDDQVDSTSQYLKWARKKGRRGTKKASGAGYASKR